MTTPKRKDNENAYRIELNGAVYRVIMQRLTNTANGAPRFRALLMSETTAAWCSVAIYQFVGHYLSELQEAEFIAKYHHISVEKG